MCVQICVTKHIMIPEVHTLSLNEKWRSMWLGDKKLQSINHFQNIKMGIWGGSITLTTLFFYAGNIKYTLESSIRPQRWATIVRWASVQSDLDRINRYNSKHTKLYRKKRTRGFIVNITRACRNAGLPAKRGQRVRSLAEIHSTLSK
jgi:hypothetical protein